jgi:hypothetical protein
MRWDVTLPAFSRCSLDNNPGNGDPSDGDPCGQINGYLLWDDAEQVEQADRWEMNVYLVGSCPKDSCVVDITPRHCKAFRPKAGEKFGWTNTSLAEKREVQSGEVRADAAGLVTLEKAIVSRGRNRIRIAR